MAAPVVPPPWPMPMLPRGSLPAATNGRGLSPSSSLTSRSFAGSSPGRPADLSGRRPRSDLGPSIGRPHSHPPQLSGFRGASPTPQFTGLLGQSVESSPGLWPVGPENAAAVCDTYRDELRVMGRELREAQQAPPTPDAEYWRGQAQLLHSQLHGLYDFAGRDEMRMQAEMKHYADMAEGESVAARWKVAHSEQKAQHLAHKTAESAVAGQEWRSRRDAEWLKTRLSAAEEQRAKLTGLSEHYKNLACKQLDQIQESNAQMASHRATISADEAKIQFLENGNGWLVQKLRTSEEESAYLDSIIPEAHLEKQEMAQQLGRAQETLAEVEAREQRTVENLQADYAVLQQDATKLRGEVWDATNQAGLAVAEMNVMSDQTQALKTKYKGVEDRRTRLTILEDANKQLRVKMEELNSTKEEQDGIVDELGKVNSRLKKRLYEVQSLTSSEAQATELQNAELREELMEVTEVLERVGSSPAMPMTLDSAQLSQQLLGRGPADQDDLRRWTQSVCSSARSTEGVSNLLPVVQETMPHMNFTADNFGGNASQSVGSLLQVGRSALPAPVAMTSPSGVSARSRADSLSPRGGISPRGSVSPPFPPPAAQVRSPMLTSGTDVRLLAAVQNVTRALSPGAAVATRGAASRSLSPYGTLQPGGSRIAPRLRR